MGVGIEVGISARALWPRGVLVENAYYEVTQAIAKTSALVANPAVPAIFEAALMHNRVLIRIDILERLPANRWRLNEVKSSTKVKVEHLEELALQAHVIAGNGLDLAEIYLVYINKEYIRKGAIDLKQLFVGEDVTENVIPLLSGVPRQIAEMHAVLRLPEAPAIRPSRHCFDPYDCEFWKRCVSDKPADWVFYIPRISKQVFDRLERYGYESMRDIPASFAKQLTPIQRRVVNAATSGNVYRSRELAKELTAMAPPVCYLDFETFSPAIPLYPNTSPYERIPFQWSLHHDGGEGFLAHAEFLADGKLDPRRLFAESLLSEVEGLTGRVAVWSSFEARVVRELAGLFPDLADRLGSVLARIIDLLPIVRNNVVHPAFRGSYSIKAIAPAIAPEIVYEGDITDGGEASAAFYRIIVDPTLTPETRAELRRALLKYCSNDSAALAQVHKWLKAGG